MKFNFLHGLTLIFVFLKLTEQIDWSWWIVWTPIWIPILLSVVAICVALFVDYKRLEDGRKDKWLKALDGFIKPDVVH